MACAAYLGIGGADAAIDDPVQSPTEILQETSFSCASGTLHVEMASRESDVRLTALAINGRSVSEKVVEQISSVLELFKFATVTYASCAKGNAMWALVFEGKSIDETYPHLARSVVVYFDPFTLYSTSDVSR